METLSKGPAVNHSLPGTAPGYGGTFGTDGQHRRGRLRGAALYFIANER